MNNYWILVPVFLPMLVGILLPALRVKNRLLRQTLVLSTLTVTAAVCVVLVAQGGGLTLLSITDALTVRFAVDDVSRLFCLIAAFAWLFVAVFSVKYMTHEEGENRFYAFLLLTLGAVIGMDFASNLITMYVFYELVTLLSMPLVLHSLKKEAVSAALKYLFYSIGGAFMALLGIFFLFHYCTTTEFAAGGTLDMALLAGHEKTLLAVIFVAIVGFGTKAGLYPMHGWLPSAHPVAPAPASALLSGLIAKAGVLGIIRVVFYLVGADFLRGSWVQYAWIGLALLTVFMGSMMAYREPLLKKRLAYSTVSQVSYVLLGLAFLTPDSVSGGLMHVVFHAAIKSCLFLCAGAIIFCTGATRVDELRGIGKRMPITMGCYTVASLALIGIPPASGFVSKWYLATGSLDAELPVVSVLSPVILLLSALLTAGYLLPLTVRGFFPGKDFENPLPVVRESPWMTVPIGIFAAASLLLGLFPNALLDFVSRLAAQLV